MMEFEFLDLATAAKKFCISKATLKAKVASGELPARRLKRKLYVRPQDVERLLTPVISPKATLDVNAIAKQAWRNAFGEEMPARRGGRRATMH